MLVLVVEQPARGYQVWLWLDVTLDLYERSENNGVEKFPLEKMQTSWENIARWIYPPIAFASITDAETNVRCNSKDGLE